MADVNEQAGYQLPATPIGGTYSIASNGYGSMTIDSGDLADVSLLGVYLTDPNLNLMDPNNTTSGLGGALLSDMDSVLAGGTGFAVPQTDTSKSSFTGNYALDAQAQWYLFEFDLVAASSMTSGSLNGSALISDPFSYVGSNGTDSGATISGTPLADTSNPGRYTLFSTNTVPNPLKIKVGSTSTFFDVVLYQASGGLLFWLDEDVADVWNGSLQQLGSRGHPVTRQYAQDSRRGPARAVVKRQRDRLALARRIKMGAIGCGRAPANGGDRHRRRQLGFGAPGRGRCAGLWLPRSHPGGGGG